MRDVSVLISTVTPPGKEKKKGGKDTEEGGKAKSLEWLHCSDSPLYPHADSKGMSISTQGEKSERERPSEQIKLPIFKWPRQVKDLSEETSSVQTSGAGA